jgi:DNA-binding transcriptional ArsR family regulator
MLRDYEAVLKAAADPNRARILKMLESGELCVCQIVAALGLSESTVSKHLSVLRAAGLVEERKEGRWVYCRLAESAVNDYALRVLSLIRGWLAKDATVLADTGRAARIRRVPLEKLCSLGPRRIFVRKGISASRRRRGEYA